MSDEIWILGATGRTGRDTARRLAERDLPLRLVGRDAGRLHDLSAALPGAVDLLAVPDVAGMAAAVAERAPAVVVNTVGPFARTAAPLVAACLPSSSYVDLANDLVAADAVLTRDAEARSAGRTLVTGAGFGVLATEAPLAALLAERPAPRSVRVDSIASIALAGGTLGEALAATIVEGLPAGGRRLSGGRLVRAGVGSHPLRLELPDGSVVVTGAWPSGDLLAAGRASGASDVIAATTEVPTGAAVRALVPLVGPLLRLPALRRLAVRRLAALPVTAGPRPREHSWGRARAEWDDGSVREAWLRTGDAGDFTAAVLAAVAARIAGGDAVPGAHTPLAATGLDLLEEAGAALVR